MAEGNVEIVKAGFAAFGEGGVDALMPFIHEEFEATTPPTLASEPDTYRGYEGVRNYFDSFYEAMEDIRWDPDEFIAVGERVVVPFTLRARGRTTGIEASQKAVQVWTLRDGKAIGVDVFPTLDEAMAAARGNAG